MFNLDKHPWVLPVLLMAVGGGWLMNTLDLLPGVNWAYVLGVAAVGLVILLQGVNKLSFVVGGFLLIGSGMAFLRQTGRLDINVQVPVMVIVLGVLMLVAHYAKLPNPPDDHEPARAETPKKQRLDVPPPA